MPKIAVIGSIITDLAVQTTRVPNVGENIQAKNLRIGPGGKGANAAVAVARAGAEAVSIGCIGDDEFGRMEMAYLDQEGVDLSGVTIHPEAATGAAIILIDAQGENTILVANGANDHLSSEAVVKKIEAQHDTLDGILINFEIPEAAVAAGARIGMDLGIPVLIDAGPPRKYAPETWAHCTILTPNALEAATLVGYPIEDEIKAEQAARELLAAGPQAVVLKLGGRGAMIITAELTAIIPSFPVEVVDTTGAGDAFSGTLSVAIGKGLSLEDAVGRANAAGALTVTRLGTMSAMPTRQEVDALLKQHEKAS
ncbi:MAG TPA: ribokinase [Anaerolineae bacterium]|nr:ribokinase [Anaerolineae bacterium]